MRGLNVLKSAQISRNTLSKALSICEAVLRKFFEPRYLEARGVEPLFRLRSVQGYP
jgi:hypothetical protein